MRFFTGDELGNLKALRTGGTSDTETKSELRTIRRGTAESARRVQALSAYSDSERTLLAAGSSNGAAELFSVAEDDTIESLQQWTETRLKTGQSYVGMLCTEKNVFSCTSNGALRMTPVKQDESDAAPSHTAFLPTRLCDWHLSDNEEYFAYGGDEVDLSIWNTEKAFQNRVEDLASSDGTAKKRKRNETLFPGEIWRAKNAPNDNLGLRQPIRITALSFISPSSGSNHRLITGTQLGSVRQYDTRAARRPVSDWKIAKVGGIEALECGFNEHEAFASDSGSNLFSIDMRNGRISYSYKGLSGAATSIAPSPSLMASVAQDRYSRIHSTFGPPKQPGQQQEHKGDVLEKIFMKSLPTVIVWDRSSSDAPSARADEEVGDDDEDDDVWDNMVNVDDGETKANKKRRDH